ncbi:MAG TPA: hypothetical protein VIN05_14545 [Roseovarius sp.]
MIAPETVYNSPQDVLGDTDVAEDDKLTILLRWEYNIRMAAAARGREMTDDDRAVLQRIQLALDGLSVIIAMNSTAAKRLGGLTRMVICRARPHA